MGTADLLEDLGTVDTADVVVTGAVEAGVKITGFGAEPLAEAK